jgi:hypothetical protein
MVNHTKVSLPQPVTHERIDVRQVPGMRYPTPANHARIVERTGPALRGDRSAPCPTDGDSSGAGAPCPTEASGN